MNKLVLPYPRFLCFRVPYTIYKKGKLSLQNVGLAFPPLKELRSEMTVIINLSDWSFLGEDFCIKFGQWVPLFPTFSVESQERYRSLLFSHSSFSFGYLFVYGLALRIVIMVFRPISLPAVFISHDCIDFQENQNFCTRVQTFPVYLH